MACIAVDGDLHRVHTCRNHACDCLGHRHEVFPRICPLRESISTQTQEWSLLDDEAPYKRKEPTCHAETNRNTPTNRIGKRSTSRKVTRSEAFRKAKQNVAHGRR